MLATDRGRGYPLSLRLRAANSGFSAHSYLWLGLENADTTTYLGSTDPFRRMNRGYITPFHNKYVFHLVMEPYDEYLPALYGTVEGGEFRPAWGSDGDLSALLDRERKLVVKPTTSGKGRGVSVLERRDDAVLVDSRELDDSAAAAAVAGLDGYVVTEFVRQHEYAETVFPDATNTLRIHSLVDPNTGEVSLLRASHRFGSDASAPTDNWSRGGYTAPVDLDTGEIGRLITLEDPPRSRPERHPGTGAQVAGVTVPHWAETCDLVRDVADLHRRAPFVGWDVAVTRDGPVILEGNARPSVVGLQLTDGILADPRFRALLEGY